MNNKVAEILRERWVLPEVWGEVESYQQNIIVPQNSKQGLMLLYKHIVAQSLTIAHTDVDVDGIGTNYILRQFLRALGMNKVSFTMNKDKTHGILDKHVEFVNSHPEIQFVIATDSSSNELETIKKFNCDVLVIDHHDMLHTETVGLCNDGVHQFVIISNMIDSTTFAEDIQWLWQMNNTVDYSKVTPFKADEHMSCGVLICEFFRLFQIAYRTSDILSISQLYQWGAVTLFTDYIPTNNRRNQWYVSQIANNSTIEPTLKRIMSALNQYHWQIDKSAVNYTIAPIFNKAIRANAGSQVLDILMNRPSDIEELKVYGDIQKEIMHKALYTKDADGEDVKIEFDKENKGYVEYNISSLGISKSYAGVIGSAISDNTKKPVACYIVKEDGIYAGSFRGRNRNVEYRKIFEGFADNIYAQGHKTAFGFKTLPEQLEPIMERVKYSEQHSKDTLVGVSLGNIQPCDRCMYHFDTWEDIKKDFGIAFIATGNARVPTDMEINIKVRSGDVKLVEETGKIFKYDVLGVVCTAFSRLVGPYFNVYVEYTSEINFFIKNI